MKLPPNHPTGAASTASPAIGRNAGTPEVFAFSAPAGRDSGGESFAVFYAWGRRTELYYSVHGRGARPDQTATWTFWWISSMVLAPNECQISLP